MNHFKYKASFFVHQMQVLNSRLICFVCWFSFHYCPFSLLLTIVFVSIIMKMTITNVDLSPTFVLILLTGVPDPLEGSSDPVRGSEDRGRHISADCVTIVTRGTFARGSSHMSVSSSTCNHACGNYPCFLLYFYLAVFDFPKMLSSSLAVKRDKLQNLNGSTSEPSFLAHRDLSLQRAAIPLT